jgi:hypothetical protein
MSDTPTADEVIALSNSHKLLKFAAENKTGLSQQLVLDLQEAWKAQANSSWSAAVAAKFWAAYDGLNSHLQPITFNSIECVRLAKKTANAYTFVLLVALVFTMGLAFIASTGDAVIKNIGDLIQAGDNHIAEIRTKLVGINDYSKLHSLDDESLPPETRAAIHEIRNKLQDVYFVSDQLFHKMHSYPFRLLGVPAYPACTKAESDAIMASPSRKPDRLCYFQGDLSDPKWKNEVVGNIADYYRLRRGVSERKDDASTKINALKSYILPALLGVLGACVFVVRNISDQIGTVTFYPTHPIRHLLRVTIGALAGVMVVLGDFLFYPGLNSAAYSFLAGYAVEALLASLDGLSKKIRAVTE